MAGDVDLVVREELVGRLTGGAGVRDVRGAAGVGKSMLLREVERRADPGDVVVLVEMQDYFTAFEQGRGAVAGPGGELRRFGRMLSVVVSGLRDRQAARGAAEGILNEIGRAVQAAGDRLDGARAAGLADELIGRVQGEANELIRARAEASGRVFLLVDTFELVADRPLGNWLLRLLAGLRGAVVAVARQSGPGAVPLAGATEVLEVGGLTVGQVRDYLVRRLGGQGAEIAAAVSGFTGGNALAVGLTADLAADMRRRGQPVTDLTGLIQEMESGGKDPKALLVRLVSRFIESADDELRLGLDCLWAVRRFDFPLLERLLAVGYGQAGWYRLAERLVGYSFVERRTPPGRPAEQYYVVHGDVRNQGLRTLEGTERLQELDRNVEEYYRKQTDEFLEGYEGWFRYLDPRWQVLVREWLYHVSQLDSAGQANGRLGLLKLFLDAVWWWGHNLPFGFCEELLTDWAEMADALGEEAGKVDRDWGERLRELYLRYPKGWRAPATPEDWGAVKKQLIFFWEQPEISGTDQADNSMRHVRALLETFLALAERFLHPGSPQVETLLVEARELFAADDDEWNVAWVWFQQGAAALGRGDVEGAVAAAASGWRTLEEMDDDDPELAANLHRVHADAAWDGGDRSLALDLYARAALHAYKFQVNVCDPNIPPIDEYTQAFLTEMHERAAERLAAVHAAGDQQAALQACARIRHFFAPYWDAAGTDAPDGTPGPDSLGGLLEAGRADEAVGRIFPPPPAPADLHQPGTEYVLTAGEVLYEMDDELTEPPGTPLPTTAG
jgi:hypothetical protein